jgi:copper transport protein
MRKVVVLAALAGLAWPAVASGHATMTQTSPSFRERVESAPGLVTLRFDQRVTAFPGSIQVRSATGRLLSGAAASGVDARWVRAPLRPLPEGAYTVRWHALSGDGHVVSGVYTFGVGVDAPPPTEAYGASGPTRAEHLVRWAYFLALALLVGGLGFRLLVLRNPLPGEYERRFYLLAGVGAVATLEVGILAFILRAQDALQLPLGRLLYGDLSPIAGGTRFGTAFIAMTLGFALVAALVFLAWLTDRAVLLWPAFLIGLGFASGLSLSGHSAVDAGSSWGSQLADWVHLSAAMLWAGGLVQLAFCIWPLAPELRREAFLRFSRVATALIALIVVAGVYLSVLRLPRVADLWEEDYGHVLLVKLGLVCVALSWGAFHHFVARPALEGRGGEGVLGRLSRSLIGESAVGMAVLLAAAVLVDSKPPPQPAQPNPPVASAAR